VRVFCFKKKS